ncbi:toll/interleukin-1 receptor domain-containing protein [Actinomyces radicidentis]|uniref:toll/interleukin-1 receptor domain-containing protein n=1 Tax=Actinomyces radicidentis TaxID=111015 RepID=UPI0026DF1D73|nr:toll/interleukin-1 receptor domain-containing protein [Actinomyces radicidentis]
MSDLPIFLSYSEDEEGTRAATHLRDALALMHVDAVMARSAIDPGADWEQTIRGHLESSEALVCVGTPGFTSRPWCQQEVGWALGRRIPIMWIQYTRDELPAGFLARTQALDAVDKQSSEVARALLAWLARASGTRDAVAETLVSALEGSESFSDARDAAGLLALVGPVDTSVWSRVEAAAEANNQVGNAVVWVEGAYRKKVSVLEWLQRRIGPAVP